MYYEVKLERLVTEHGSAIVDAPTPEAAAEIARHQSWSACRYARVAGDITATRAVQTTSQMGGQIKGTEVDLKKAG